MTTKLLPRLAATGALAAALTGVSAVTGLATPAHASTPVATAVVTVAANGGIDEHLTYDQVTSAAASQLYARQLCQDTVVPSANAVRAGSLTLTTCTTYTHIFSADLQSRGSAITINYNAGQVTARVG